MSDERQTPPAAIVFHQSTIIRGVAIWAVTHTLSHFHLLDSFTSDDISAIVNQVLAIGGSVAGAATIIIARATQKAAPTIVASKATAAVLNAQPSQETPK